MFKFKKLNARGVAHHAVLMLFVVVAVGGFGAYTVFRSNADTVNTANYTLKAGTENGCWLTGRKWDSTTNTCTSTCLNSGTTLNTNGANPGFCTGQIAQSIDATTCIVTLHRMYVYNVGCARKYDQTSSNDSRRCTGWSGYPTAIRTTYANYVADSNGLNDKCVATTVATPTPTSTPTGGTTTPPATSDSISDTYCQLLGRKGANGICQRSCTLSNDTLLVTADGVDYCNSSISTMTPANCSGTFRVYVTINGHNVGCARRPDQTSATDKLRCITSAGYTYYVADKTGLDRCEKSAPTSGGTSGSSTTTGGNTGGTTNGSTSGGGAAGSTGFPAIQLIPSVWAAAGMHDKVESGISKVACQQLLGRQWDPSLAGSAAGCSESICIDSTAKTQVKLVASNGSWYCDGYASQIDQTTCGSLNRKWLPNVSACAARPDPRHLASISRPGRFIQAYQCLKPYTTYVQRDGLTDSCKRPSTLQVLGGITQTTFHPLGSLFQLPSKGICALHSDKIFVNGQCVNQPQPVLDTSTS